MIRIEEWTHITVCIDGDDPNRCSNKCQFFQKRDDDTIKCWLFQHLISSSTRRACKCQSTFGFEEKCKGYSLN